MSTTSVSKYDSRLPKDLVHKKIWIWVSVKTSEWVKFSPLYLSIWWDNSKIFTFKKVSANNCKIFRSVKNLLQMEGDGTQHRIAKIILSAIHRNGNINSKCFFLITQKKHFTVPMEMSTQEYSARCYRLYSNKNLTLSNFIYGQESRLCLIWSNSFVLTFTFFSDYFHIQK